jgi:4-hydroxybenzoate polyprenyltransferase
VRKIIDALVYSSFIPAFYIAIFTLYAFLVTSHSIDFNLVIINFLGTFVSYNAIAFISLRFRGIKSKRMQWQSDNRKALIALSVIAITGILYFYNSLNIKQFINLGHLFVLIILYEKRSKNSFSFRAKMFIKPLIISYIWTMVAVGNVLFESMSFSWTIFIESFLSIAALTLFYDIRDKDYDKNQGLETLVHKFGIRKVKSIAYRFYLVSLLIRMLAIPFREYWYLYILEIIVFSLLLKRAKPETDNHLYVLAVDGLIIFKLLYVLEFY